MKSLINKIIHADCLEILPNIENESIDMILCDLPYAETNNNWDVLINPVELWKQYRRIIKEDGAILLTASFKFAVQLYLQAPDLYKYEWIWEKENGTNMLTVNYQPLRIHEYILVFSKSGCSHGSKTAMRYNPQKTIGKPYIKKSGDKMSSNWSGGDIGGYLTSNESGMRHPKTIQKFIRNDRKKHSTQKPCDMFEYLIQTYTNKGDIVLDNCGGSGTTAEAAIATDRNFILIEKEERFCKIAEQRIKRVQLNLF